MGVAPLLVVPRQEDLGAGTPDAGTFVVIDVLRATSTVVTALAHGARAVLPCTDPAEARRVSGARGGGCLLAGESDSLRIHGFDLGNSPRECTPAAVGGREMVLVTSNGTRALRSLPAGAGEVVLASFLNAGAVARHLAGAEPGGVTIICSGTRGGFSLEDFLCAGCLVDYLAAAGAPLAPDDAAMAARDAFRQNRARLPEALAEGRHARRLAALGLGEDVAWCAQLDLFPLVPIYRDGRVAARAQIGAQ